MYVITSDQIDENLRTALQLDLLNMAPGLRVQVSVIFIQFSCRVLKNTVHTCTDMHAVIWYHAREIFVQVRRLYVHHK